MINGSGPSPLIQIYELLRSIGRRAIAEKKNAIPGGPVPGIAELEARRAGDEPSA
jgi:hypothetical protein